MLFEDCWKIFDVDERFCLMGYCDILLEPECAEASVEDANNRFIKRHRA